MMKKWAIVAGLAAASLMPGAVHAQQDQNNDQYPPGQEKSLDVTAFDAFCQKDAPYVRYDIKTHGFDPAGHTATLTITDINDKPIDTLENMPLTGKFLYPGTKLDAAGHPVDWTGWVKENGVWREQTVDEPGSDYIYRLGLKIRVDVNPTAFVDPPVTYPDADPNCANPSGVKSTNIDQGVSPEAIAAPAGTLPSTGSDGTSVFLQIGALLLLGGGLLAIGAHRRRSDAPA